MGLAAQVPASQERMSPAVGGFAGSVRLETAGSALAVGIAASSVGGRAPISWLLEKATALAPAVVPITRHCTAVPLSAATRV